MQRPLSLQNVTICAILTPITELYACKTVRFSLGMIGLCKATSDIPRFSLLCLQNSAARTNFSYVARGDKGGEREDEEPDEGASDDVAVLSCHSSREVWAKIRVYGWRKRACRIPVRAAVGRDWSCVCRWVIGGEMAGRALTYRAVRLARDMHNDDARELRGSEEGYQGCMGGLGCVERVWCWFGLMGDVSVDGNNCRAWC